MTADAVTVHLVDDHEAFRQSTRWVLEAAEFRVIDYADGATLVSALRDEASGPGAACVLTDLRMPGMSGLELLGALQKMQCALPVVMITAHGDITQAVEAMRRGAASFLEKPFERDVLVETLRDAVRQPVGLRDPETAGERMARLSPRERQVMELVTAGRLNKTIADVLGISIKTVELHRANMMNKLEARNVPELIRIVLGYP